MARIVMFTYGGDVERTVRRALAAQGHDFRAIEPDFPQCKANVDAADPEVFLLDATSKASHVRESAAYFTGSKRYKGRPVFVVSPMPGDVGRFSMKVPAAKHAAPEDVARAVAQGLAGRTA